jgi:hypothetical protein
LLPVSVNLFFFLCSCLFKTRQNQKHLASTEAPLFACLNPLTNSKALGKHRSLLFRLFEPLDKFKGNWQQRSPPFRLFEPLDKIKGNWLAQKPSLLFAPFGNASVPF